MLKYLRKKVFIPYFDKRDQNFRLTYLPEVLGELTADLHTLRDLQLKKLIKLVRLAYANVPFYRNLYDNHAFNVNELQNYDDIERIPCITKEDIRRYGDEFLNKDFDKAKLIESATGGSTNTPIKLFYSRDCLSRKQACTMFFSQWMGCALGERSAYLWGAPQDFPGGFSTKWKIKNYLTSPSLMLFSSYLDKETLWNYYKKLINFKPNMLQAYPTPLYILASFLKENGLGLEIPVIQVTAEYFYNFQREMIEDVFKIKVFNWYGARELGHVANECDEHNGMHINSYGLYLEVLKEGKPVIGKEGEIVATDLLNMAMPLIRYKIGDIGMISDRRCRCGSSLSLLESIGGRYVDTFRKRDGTYIPGVAFTNRVIKGSLEIKELQIVQKDYNTFVLNLVQGNEFSTDSVEKLKREICLFMHDELEFEVNILKEIPIEKSGKKRFCKCEIE